MPSDARVLIDLSPVLLATALARVLAGVGYDVDLGDGVDAPDVAVVSERNGNRAPIVIELPPLTGETTIATVSNRGATRLVPVRNLRDLLAVIEHEISAQPLPFEA
jgi:hypothetical protein